MNMQKGRFDNRCAKRKQFIIWVTWLCAGGIALWYLGDYIGLLPRSEASDTFRWTTLLVWGTMLTGFLFQPMLKEKFPGPHDPRVADDTRLHLKDHETLLGYYPIVALCILACMLVLPIFLPEYPIFEIKSAHFWWSAGVNGFLNFVIFSLFTKGLRYGDVSLVSATWALAPIFVLPISFIVYYLLGSHAPIGNPSVSLAGLCGILLTVGALVFQSFTATKKTATGKHAPPAGDFFAHHPILSGTLAMLVAGVAVNFDKIAVESANPFLAALVVSSAVSIVALLVTLRHSGTKRVMFIARTYRNAFVKVGVVYAGILLVMNFTLLGANVNYYASIKRASVLFGAIYGVYVLREGTTPRERLVRIVMSVLIVAGIVLITLKG